MARIQDLMKGELDWHEKVNSNFHVVEDSASAAQSQAGDASYAASAAQSAADAAQQTADNAVSAAATAQATADGAASSASAANQAAAAAQASADNAQLSANLRLLKPVGSPFTEGLVYQNADGSTSLRQGGGFKYTIEVDNGVDGLPAAVTYFDDCSGFNPGKGSDMGDWGTTDLIKNYFRPCVIKPGAAEPEYFLMQNNMTKKEDGSAANLTGADGDVMIQVRKLYGKFTKIGKILRVSISNVKEDATWFCFNDIGGVEKDFVYVGAFKAGVTSGDDTTMRSISGVSTLGLISLDVARTYANNRGAGYHLSNLFMIFLWQVMFLMVYKSRNSQEVLGKGRTNSTSPAITGLLADKPFCYGNQDGATGVKFLGREDFYGNVFEFVDGIVLDRSIFKITRDPSKYGVVDEYEIITSSNLLYSNAYLKEVQGTNDLGFLPRVASGGSEITFWCDSVETISAERRSVVFGGYYSDGAKAGAFRWLLSVKSTDTNIRYYGSRLFRE